MPGVHRKFGIRRWQAWFPGADEDSRPDIKFVPPLLRRRLSRLSANLLCVAHTCLRHDTGIPIVFASRHGELTRTSEILGALAKSEPPSPTAFSLSVHNSGVGLLGMIRGDRIASTAVAAGELTLAMGVLEALVQAESAQGQALLVYAEEAPPEIYAGQMDADARDGAVALLLDTGGAELVLAATAQDIASGQVPDRLRSLLDVLAGKAASAQLGDADQAWQIERNVRAA